LFIILSPFLTFIILRYSFKPSKKSLENYRNDLIDYFGNIQLRNYLKNKFPILTHFDEDKYNNITTINLKDYNEDKAMFQMYLEAELLGADAIILNDTNVSTKVSGHISTNSRGEVSGGTSSSNMFHITATLVKRKIENNKNSTFCKECGSKINKNDKYCNNCGSKL